MNDWRLRNWSLLPSLTVAEVATVTGASIARVRGMVRAAELELVAGTRLVRTDSVLRRFGACPTVEATGAQATPRRRVRPGVAREAAAFLRRTREAG